MKTAKSIAIAISALALAALVACGSDPKDDPIGGDVYVAGTTLGAQGPRATLWTNGAAKPLSSSDSEAHSVFVSDGAVYVAGCEFDDEDARAVLWKDGNPQYLPGGGAHYVQAHSVHVSGGKVYVVGGGMDFAGGMPVFVAKVWVDGLTNSLAGAEADSIFAAGDKVYVAGWDMSPTVGVAAKLWTNDAPQTLSPLGDGHMSQAFSVFVSGGKVYVAGNSGNESQSAVLWTDGAPQKVSQYESEAASVFVSGGDVYVAGCEYRDAASQRADATVWKNGGAQRQAGSGDTKAMSVFVTPNGDVYAAGVEYDAQETPHPRLWKNGAKQDLGGEAADSVALSVFVSERAK